MSSQRERPDWVRRLNQFGTATGAPEALVSLDPDELLAEARRTTGLDEIGDATFLETFARRLRAIDAEANANLLGRLLARAEVLRVLQTRLRLHAAWARDPSILETKIERPLFVVGAPRTGTTILLELLALDPQLRPPIAWEAHHPLPHPGAPDPAAAMRLAESEQEFWADIQPELMTLHELRSDLPCECVHFMSLDFGSGYWAMHYPTPSFDTWAGSQPDLVARTYQEHRRFLQTLQSRDAETSGASPRRWLLKSPAHLATIFDLFAAYPDAVIVHTHRDPHKFVGSAASTTALLHWLRSDVVDPMVYGQVALHGFAFMLNQVRTGRRDGMLPADQFVDSHYQDLIADPAAAVRRVYDQAGLEWPADHDDRIRAYLRDKPKGKFGKHVYSLSDYGLKDEDVTAAYADYVEHYQVAMED